MCVHLLFTLKVICGVHVHLVGSDPPRVCLKVDSRWTCRWCAPPCLCQGNVVHLKLPQKGGNMVNECVWVDQCTLGLPTVLAVMTGLLSPHICWPGFHVPCLPLGRQPHRLKRASGRPLYLMWPLKEPCKAPAPCTGQKCFCTEEGDSIGGVVGGLSMVALRLGRLSIQRACTARQGHSRPCHDGTRVVTNSKLRKSWCMYRVSRAAVRPPFCSVSCLQPKSKGRALFSSREISF
jgi:hypothetical protein